MAVALSSRAPLYLDIHFRYKTEVLEAVALLSDVVKNVIYYCRIERQSNFITFFTSKTFVNINNNNKLYLCLNMPYILTYSTANFIQ